MVEGYRMPVADFTHINCQENSKNLEPMTEAADIKTMVCEGL